MRLFIVQNVGHVSKMLNLSKECQLYILNHLEENMYEQTEYPKPFSDCYCNSHIVETPAHKFVLTGQYEYEGGICKQIRLVDDTFEDLYVWNVHERLFSLWGISKITNRIYNKSVQYYFKQQQIADCAKVMPPEHIVQWKQKLSEM